MKLLILKGFPIIYRGHPKMTNTILCNSNFSNFLVDVAFVQMIVLIHADSNFIIGTFERSKVPQKAPVVNSSGGHGRSLFDGPKSRTEDPSHSTLDSDIASVRFYNHLTHSQPCRPRHRNSRPEE